MSTKTKRAEAPRPISEMTPTPNGHTTRAVAGDPAPEEALGTLLTAGHRRTRRRRILLALFGLLALAAAVVAGLKWMAVKDMGEAPKFVTAPVTKGDLKSSVAATGTVQALNTVDVGAEISGRIFALYADFNDSVTKGQVLAEIDPEQLKASVAQAKAQVLAAEAQVAEAEATLVQAQQDAARSKDLAGKGLVASKELESATATAIRAAASLKSAKASSALAKASYDAAHSKLGKTQVFSPISGTVLSRAVEVGQTLNAGMQTPVLFTIAEDLKRMRLSSRVDEADIGAVTKGQSATFTVDAYPAREFTSEVTAVRNVAKVDQNVVSYEVLLSVDNQEMLLKPGMTASVEIITKLHSDVMLVPSKALRFTPPTEGGSGFRGPPMGIPFIGRSKGMSGRAKRPDPMEALGKVEANQGILWVLNAGKAPAGTTQRPVKVNRIATDGVQTAISSDRIKPGDQVIVDLDDAAQKTP